MRYFDIKYAILDKKYQSFVEDMNQSLTITKDFVKKIWNPPTFIPILFLISPIYCISLLGFIAFIFF